MSRNGLTSG